MVRKLKPHVDHNMLIRAYNALVLPHFDYCCEVWDTINFTLCNRLQKLQNRAARIIVGRINEHGQSELALAELNWKTLSERRAQFVASQIYKITHDLAPKRLSNIFHEMPSSRHYNLRGSSTKLCLPQPKTDYPKKSFSIEGKNCGTASQMIYEVKNHLLPLKPAFVHLANFLKFFNLFTYFM